MEEIRILQLGEEDFHKIYTLPQWIRLDYVNNLDESSMKKNSGKPYDLCFLDRTPQKEEIALLYEMAKVYAFFITENVETSGQTARLCRCKKAQRIEKAEIQRFLSEETRYYYPKPYGEKFNLRDVAVAQGFKGSVKWNGNHDVTLEGGFGDELRQAVYWRYNALLEQERPVDLWLEYSKDEEVDIALEITLFAGGSVSEAAAHWTFDERDLEDVIRIDSPKTGWAFFSICAKGRGKLQVTALHQRRSRGRHGYFLPGGERYVTSDREEAFCYFEPGDLKPPLCVYFSGYKTLEGFEGYYMMKGMGCPFLLVAEARLEGGGFYMGSAEYEQIYAGMIRKYMKELGFTKEQVVLSGLSMGTYGALYYGCDIMPYAVILGKPLASIGDVAANERYNRPGTFPTSLDVLMCQCNDLEEEAVQTLNARFWDKFEGVDWGNTRFIISYMLEDDYDANAYQMLISHIQSEGTSVYGKGLRGRHNDNTGGIVNWFLDQYKKVLDEDFGRGKRKK